VRPGPAAQLMPFIAASVVRDKRPIGKRKNPLILQRNSWGGQNKKKDFCWALFSSFFLFSIASAHIKQLTAVS
jgi:hypothetical protein